MMNASYDLKNQQLVHVMDAMQALLKLDYRISGVAFRNLSEKLYRFVHGGSWTRIEPDAYVSRAALGCMRKDLVAEHMDPVNQIFQRWKQKPMTNAELFVAFAAEMKIVHIMKTEDQKLRDAGFTSKRPNPAVAYAECGIEIVYLPMWDRRVPVTF